MNLKNSIVLLALAAVVLVGVLFMNDRSADSADAPTPVVSEGEAGAVVPAGTEMVVYKSPTCGCCEMWIDHVEEAGFTVDAEDVQDLRPVKAENGITPELSSCHTAIVEGYVIEGHVPADVIARLLEERPDIRGLTVPGMPIGSPGMEQGTPQPYDILAIGRDGSTSVYASR